MLFGTRLKEESNEAPVASDTLCEDNSVDKRIDNGTIKIRAGWP